MSEPPFRFDTSPALYNELLRGKQGKPYGLEDDPVQGRPAPRPLTSPGRTVVLNPVNNEDTIDAYANDPLINEWGVYIAPAPSSIQFLATGGLWLVTVQVIVAHDSAQFVYYRSIFNQSYKPVPIVGLAIAVHGQNVRVGLRRVDPDAVGEVKIACAVIPRCPCPTYLNETGEASSLGPFTSAIPAMSRHVKLFTALNPGDTLIFLGANGVSIVGTYPLVDADLLAPIPMPPDAAYVRFTTTAPLPKSVSLQFESWF